MGRTKNYSGGYAAPDGLCGYGHGGQAVEVTVSKAAGMEVDGVGCTET